MQKLARKDCVGDTKMQLSCYEVFFQTISLKLQSMYRYSIFNNFFLYKTCLGHTAGKNTVVKNSQGTNQNNSHSTQPELKAQTLPRPSVFARVLLLQSFMAAMVSFGCPASLFIRCQYESQRLQRRSPLWYSFK